MCICFSSMAWSYLHSSVWIELHLNYNHFNTRKQVYSLPIAVPRLFSTQKWNLWCTRLIPRIWKHKDMCYKHLLKLLPCNSPLGFSIFLSCCCTDSISSLLLDNCSHSFPISVKQLHAAAFSTEALSCSCWWTDLLTFVTSRACNIKKGPKHSYSITT